MKLLTQFDEKHPLATAILGVFGAFVSWLMQHIEDIQRIAAFIGTIAGAGVAVVTLMIKIHVWCTRNKPRPKIADDDDLP